MHAETGPSAGPVESEAPQPSGLSPATVAGIAIVVLHPLMARLLARFLPLEETAARVSIQLFMAWMAAAAILLLVIYREKRPLRSVGLVPFQWSDLLWAAGGFVLTNVLVLATLPVVSALGLETLESGTRRLAQLSPWLRIAAAITAGITEEILFRGYLVERLAWLTGRLGRGVALSWGVFTLLHLPFWGAGGALQIGLLSLVFYIIYLRRRSILPCILLHVANDLYAFLLVPLMIPEFP